MKRGGNERRRSEGENEGRGGGGGGGRADYREVKMQGKEGEKK